MSKIPNKLSYDAEKCKESSMIDETEGYNQSSWKSKVYKNIINQSDYTSYNPCTGLNQEYTNEVN